MCLPSIVGRYTRSRNLNINVYYGYRQLKNNNLLTENTCRFIQQKYYFWIIEYNIIVLDILYS